MVLRGLIKLMAAAGVIVVAAVMVSGMFGPGENENSGGAAKRVPIADLPAGELRRVEWNGKPILILHRDEAMRAALDTPAAPLRDADGSWSQQPDGLPAQTRSTDPRYFVAVALGTDLNCTLSFVPAGGQFKGAPWPGGFQDTCRKSRYDLAGRVFDGQEAQRNLSVPPHRIEGDTLVLGNQ